MLTTAHSRGLAGYFQQSGRFYYFLTDLHGYYIYINPVFQKRFSHLTADFYSTKAEDTFIASDKDKCRSAVQQCLQNPGTTVHTELQVKMQDGSSLIVQWELSVYPNENNTPEYIQAIGFSTDELQESGKNNRELPERYTAYEQSTEGLWRFEFKEPVSATATSEEIFNHSLKYAYLAECNDNMAHMYGYEKAEDLIGATIKDLMDLENVDRMSYMKNFISNGFKMAGVETREFDRYGNVLYFLNNMRGVIENGMLKRLWGTQRDITGQRMAEEKIKYLAHLMETVSDIIISQDNEYNIVSWNKIAEEVYGYKAEEVIGRKTSEFLNFEFQGVSREEIYAIINAVGEWRGEANTVSKSGRPITILATVTKIINEKGEMTGFVSISKEITERKNTEDQLRRQSAILDNVSDLIMTTDFNLTILSWNKKAEEVVGYSAAEAIGKFMGDIVRPDYGHLTPKEAAGELNEKGFWQGEISFVNKNGIKKHILHTSSYLLNAAGERIAIIGTGKDITERKKAEEQLQKSELFYRNLIAHSLDGVLVTDETGKIRFASPSITEILGYEIDDAIGKITFDFAHPEDRQVAISAFQNELADNPQIRFIRVRLRKKTGEWTWCIIRGHNLMQNPYVNGMMVYFYDDTLRKQAEDALIESENKLRSQANILTNVNDIIVTTDLNRAVTSWNKVTEKLTGITEAEAMGKPLRDSIEMDFSPFTIDQVADIIFKEGIWRGEMFFTGRNGDKVHILLTGSLLQNDEGQNIGLLGVGKDITERKKAEATLQQSELFYRNMISHSLDGIIMTNASGQITYCGPSVTKLSGYQPEDLLSRNMFELVHPDDAASAMNLFILELNKQSVLNYTLLRLKHSNGNWVWCTVRGHNLLNNPIFNSIVIYFADDTKRKETEDRLRESEEHFRNLIYNLKQGVILQNEKGEMIVSNQAALDMLGVTEDQLLGKTSFDPRWNVVHENGHDFPGHTHPVPVAIETKKPVRDVVMDVYRPLTNDRVWLLVNADPILDNEGKIVNIICSFTDITEQKRLSQELIEQEIQKQKQLTQATIDGQEKERQEIGKELHDNINQHLTITRLYLEVAREKAAGEMLEMINLSHKNLAGAINEIRNMSQSLVPPTLGDLGLIESILDLCDSLERTHAFNIDFLYRHFKEELLADNQKLMFFRIIQEQVNNIIRHAAASNIHIRLQSDAEYIILTIEDNGKGFDPANYKKGQGFINISNRAGLFNGKVEIDAAPGKGCTITVVVPLETA